MTPGERLVATITGGPVDRPALPLWIGFAPWPSTLDRWRAESGIADLDVQRYFGLDPWFEVAPLEYGAFPPFEHVTVSDDGEFVVTRDGRGITARNRRGHESMPEWIAHPVTNLADWGTYKAERFSCPVDDRLHAMDAFLRAAAQSRAGVQVGVFPWGMFGTLRDLVGTEECLIAFYDQPELVRDIVTTLTDLWLALYERTAARTPIDHVHIWEDMSGKQGSLISMAMVEEFMMPSYDRVAAFARAHGVPVVSVDTDGTCDELVEVMTRHGINAFMPFEVQAGNDVEAFRRRYPRLGIMGGLDKTALCAGPARLKRELDRAERMLADGRYVAGFDHLIPPDVPWEPFRYAVTELSRMVGL